MDPSALLSSYPAMQSATAPLLAKGRDNVKWRLAVNFACGLMYVCMYVRMVTKAGWILKGLAVFSGVIGPSTRVRGCSSS